MLRNQLLQILNVCNTALKIAATGIHRDKERNICWLTGGATAVHEIEFALKALNNFIIGESINELELAKLFHETYEKLAPEYGYETREDTKSFDANTKNGKLMIATCKEILCLLRQKL
jgi:hypothetical protein